MTAVWRGDVPQQGPVQSPVNQGSAKGECLGLEEFISLQVGSAHELPGLFHSAGKICTITWDGTSTVPGDVFCKVPF